jgi:acetylornithine deacetylase/succinyl-diaminopimelate desuccinylase-like protein
MNQWSNVNWDEVLAEAVQDLQALLRIDTTNPPGREKAAAEFIAERLREDGLEPTLLDSAPERTNLVVRIDGQEDLAPLLLSAHTDVVPAVGNWTHPPFGGEIHDGMVWGRGAIDMKNMVVMCMWMMKLIARSGQKPRRPIIFAAVADEEAGCAYGSHWLVDHHPETIQAGYMITEVGGFSMTIQGKRFYPIQVAEKGQAAIKMRAKSEAGHGSLPKKDSSIAKLTKAIHTLTQQSLPKHITPPQELFIREVASHLPFPLSKIFPLFLTPIGDTLLSMLPPDQAGPLHACLHNTVSPTIFRAGDKENVIPGEAEAILDGRTLPGQTSQDLLREIKQLVGRDFEFEILHEQGPVSMDDFETDLFHIMKQSIQQHDPQGIPVPYMVPGFTDAKAYQRLGMKCYGFSPLKLPDSLSFSSLFHNVDERIPVEGFKWGIRVLADVVGQFVGVTH